MRTAILAITTVILLAGCTKSPEPMQAQAQSQNPPRNGSVVPIDFSKNSSEGLPKFKLVGVYNGGLMHLGPKDQVVILPFKEGSGYVTYPTAESFESLSTRPPDQPLQLANNNQITEVPAGTYVDKNGVPKQFIDDQVIQIEDNGKKIGAIPMRTATPNACYYATKHAIFGRERTKAPIRKLMDLQGQLVGFDSAGDDLVIMQRMIDDSINIIKLSVTAPVKLLIQSQGQLVSQIAHLDPLGRLTIRQGQNVATVDGQGNINIIPGAMYDLSHFKYKNNDCLIGLVAVKPDKPYDKPIPAMWNKDQKPVPFTALMTDSQSTIKSLEQVNRARIVSNSEGYIAIEMSGFEQLTNPSVTFRTYLLKAIE